MKQLTPWGFASEPSDDGKPRAKSTLSERRPVKDGTTSKSSSRKSQKTDEDAPLLSMLASLPDLKLRTCIDKLSDYQRSIQAQKLLRKWQEDLILGGRDCSPFWDEFSKEISELLWLPTKTDSQGLDLTLSNGYVSNLIAKSWFSTKITSVPTKSLLPISSPSCTVSPAGFIPLENTPSKSKNSYKKAPRHKRKKAAPNRTLKIRVYPEAKLHKVWKQWLAAARYCYNQAISLIKSNPSLSAYSLRDAVRDSDLPDWVKNAPNHPRENAIFDAHDACKQAKKQGGNARYRSCREPVQAIKFNACNFKSGTWYPGLVKKLNFKTSEPIPSNCEYATQLVRDRQRWFAIFPTRVEAIKTVSNNVIALDPGVRTFLTGYDGSSLLEFCKADIGRIQRLCSHLDKLISSSAKACRKQKRQMYKAASRIRIRIRNLIDECHKQIANYLTTHYRVIFLPTFETSQMVVKSKRKLNTKTARAMLTWGHYRFERHLKQVASLRSVVVVDVNESYTSKTCTACGFVHEKLGGSKNFKCPSCGHKHDRDWGGARNIFIRALRDGSFALSLSVEGIAIASDVFVHICSA